MHGIQMLNQASPKLLGEGQAPLEVEAPPPLTISRSNPELAPNVETPHLLIFEHPLLEHVLQVIDRHG